jgi:hypothetical protein
VTRRKYLFAFPPPVGRRHRSQMLPQVSAPLSSHPYGLQSAPCVPHLFGIPPCVCNPSSPPSAPLCPQSQRSVRSIRESSKSNLSVREIFTMTVETRNLLTFPIVSTIASPAAAIFFRVVPAIMTIKFGRSSSIYVALCHPSSFETTSGSTHRTRQRSTHNRCHRNCTCRIPSHHLDYYPQVDREVL